VRKKVSNLVETTQVGEEALKRPRREDRRVKLKLFVLWGSITRIIMRQSSILKILFCFSLVTAQAQSPSSSPRQLTPQAAYDQATRPLDITRRSPQNWSEVELAALKIATEQAKADCVSRSPDQFTGEDLLAYARLCALGQEWKPVEQAASNYLNAQKAATPVEKLIQFHNLATAFDYEVQASLRLKDPERALLAAQTMLRTVPYDDLTSDATTSTVHYIQLIHTDQALALLAQRQPLLLSLLRAHVESSTPAPSISHPTFPLRALYTEAIAFPAMLQFVNQMEAAAASFAELEATLPSSLSPDDSAFITETRSQYLLLGSHLPTITTFAWLPDSAATGIPPEVNNNFGSATVFLLFPDWCNQCVALHPTFIPASKRLREYNAHFFALLAQANPAPKVAPKVVSKAVNKPDPSGAVSKSARIAPFPGGRPDIPHVELQLNVKPTAATLLVGTPTFVVPSQTVDSFVATDFPLIVVADHNGIIRSIQVAPDNAMVPGGVVDQIVDHVVNQWPPPKP
jgi:thiol-disulfide isomerase/thioredoxin